MPTSNSRLSYQLYYIDIASAFLHVRFVGRVENFSFSNLNFFLIHYKDASDSITLIRSKTKFLALEGPVAFLRHVDDYLFL